MGLHGLLCLSVQPKNILGPGHDSLTEKYTVKISDGNIKHGHCKNVLKFENA